MTVRWLSKINVFGKAGRRLYSYYTIFATSCESSIIFKFKLFKKLWMRSSLTCCLSYLPSKAQTNQKLIGQKESEITQPSGSQIGGASEVPKASVRLRILPVLERISKEIGLLTLRPSFRSHLLAFPTEGTGVGSGRRDTQHTTTDLTQPPHPIRSPKTVVLEFCLICPE